MNCEEVQNRLLGLLDPNEVPPRLQEHLNGCELCVRFYERMQWLNRELAALPVPSSEDRKLAFVDSLTADGPIITTIPRPAAAEFPWRRVAAPLAGLAAAVAVAVGMWQALPPTQPPVAHEPLRHELLQRVVRLNRDLARANRPNEQLQAITRLAAELRHETRLLAKAADPTELQSLARMYDRVVSHGVVRKAKELTLFNSTAAERQQVLSATAEELARTVRDAAELATIASPQARPALEAIAEAARSAQTQLPQ